MGAEDRRRAGRVAGGARDLHRHAKLRTSVTGLVELDDHLARPHQLRVERLVEVEHGLEAAVVLS